jgi:hypothetical protein
MTRAMIALTKGPAAELPDILRGFSGLWGDLPKMRYARGRSPNAQSTRTHTLW